MLTTDTTAFGSGYTGVRDPYASEFEAAHHFVEVLLGRLVDEINHLAAMLDAYDAAMHELAGMSTAITRPTSTSSTAAATIKPHSSNH